MFNGENLITKQALSWKKQFDVGVIIPSDKRHFVNCTKELICDDSEDCDETINQEKVYASNLN